MQPCENKLAERKHVHIYLKYKYTNNNTPSTSILKKKKNKQEQLLQKTNSVGSIIHIILFLEVTSNSFHCNLAHTQSPTTKLYIESRAPFFKLFLSLFLAPSNSSCDMWVQLPHGMWDVSSLTRTEPASPVLKHGF